MDADNSAEIDPKDAPADSLVPNPSNPQNFYELGRTLMAEQRFEEALELLQKAVTWLPISKHLSLWANAWSSWAVIGTRSSLWLLRLL